MWVLLLPVGLGWALLPHGTPPPSPSTRDPSGGCQPCRSPHRQRAQANATLGAGVTLGCPAAGAPLGRLLAVQWRFRGDPAGPAALVCLLSGGGRPRCGPPYGERAELRGSGGGGAPGVLVLRGLREGDAGTYTCLLLGEDECACGEVTLRLGRGAPYGPPCSGTPPHGTFGLGLLLLLLLLLLHGL